MDKILAFVGVVVIDVPIAILRGFVFSVLWLWFMVPLGLMEIGIAHAIGIMIITGLLLSGLSRREYEGEWLEKAIAQGVHSVVYSLITWGIGAGVHAFM